jgi:hypothetical protein
MIVDEDIIVNKPWKMHVKNAARDQPELIEI